ncbi:MAG: PKD domain-containing protein [Acidobacteriia bacterium]|nr:PKD domain-containing protein [Terriglobia bacterium]
MRDRYARVVTASIAILLLSIPGVAQQAQANKKKFTSASLDGATGLFRTWDAETLRQGEFNISLGVDYTNRDPGRLIIRKFPIAVGVGMLNRLELFGSWEAQKSINAPGIIPYGVLPGQLPQPATTLTGTPFFNNDAPFVDVPHASAPGDIRFGGILNALSERRGNPLAMSFAGFMKIPSNKGITGMNRGLTNGTNEGGFAMLLSKRAGRIAALHLNLGFNFAGTAENRGVTLADLQNSFILRGGLAFPNFGKIQFIAETNIARYFGGNTSGLNPASPVDAIFGFKVYPKEWISIGGGYQGHFNRLDTDLSRGILRSGVNGFVAQVTFEKRRHDPPKVTCAVSPQQIIQDEKATVRANVVIPEGATITYSWASSGGKLSGSGDTVTFDATGVAPGKYTVTATVADDYGHSVPCTAEITVNKKYLPPTVTCAVSPNSIQVGESATVRATATSPDGSPLTYSWTVNGQAQAASGSSFTFGSTGRQPGNYTIAVTVNTGKFTASCSSSVTVREIPIPPPTIQCLTPTVDIDSGGTTQLRVQATAERATPTVTWSATGGTVSGAGQTATFDGAGLSAGTYTVTATVDNGRGGRASCTMTVNVSQKINVPGFAETKWRVNNVAKAILDNVAVQMKNDSRLRANVVGYTDDSRRETRVKDLGLKRAQAVVEYLVSKGIDASRFTALSGGVSTVGNNKTTEGRAENRHAEIQLSVR